MNSIKKSKSVVGKVNSFISSFLKDTTPELKSGWNSEVNQQSLVDFLQETKDKNLPKKGKSSYIIFCSVIRESIKKDNPSLKATEITVEMGRRWREMSDTQKESYVKLADEDKLRYQSDMEKIGAFVKKEPSKKKKTAYVLFCASKRVELKPLFTVNKDLTVELARLWSLLTPEQKASYEGSSPVVSEQVVVAVELPVAAVVEKPSKKERTKKVEEVVVELPVSAVVEKPSKKKSDKKK